VEVEIDFDFHFQNDYNGSRGWWMASSDSVSLAQFALGGHGTIADVGGERGFRRRLMEMGLVPGTVVKLVRVAPLGDPLEIEVRGCRLSIRRQEAHAVRVEHEGACQREGQRAVA
jgi:ferrous iron transport protein A